MLNLTTICHARQRPMTRLSRRTATTTRFSPKTLRNRQCRGTANIHQVSLTLREIANSAYLRSESGMVMRLTELGQPLLENHRCTADSTSPTNCPSSVSSSGNSSGSKDFSKASPRQASKFLRVFASYLASATLQGCGVPRAVAGSVHTQFYRLITDYNWDLICCYSDSVCYYYSRAYMRGRRWLMNTRSSAIAETALQGAL